MKINPDSVPSSIAAAVKQIVAGLDEVERASIKTTNSSSVHFWAGRHIRNNWSLWAPDSPLKRDAVTTYRIAHADDISGLIFEWVWCIVCDRPFDPIAHCQRYHEHWARCGMTALQAGGWTC